MRIYSGLVTSNPTASQLYFFCKEEDKAGKGWVVLSIKTLMNFFNKTRKTILNWSKSNLYFSNKEVSKDRLYIKYNSIKKIRGNIDTPYHASFKGSLETIQTLDNLKKAAYEAALHRQQLSCKYKIERSTESSKQIFNPTLESIRRSPGRVGCDYINQDKGTVFVKKHKETVGASQITVAEKLGVTRQTLMKYTSSIPRLKVFKRVNIFKKAPEFYYLFEKNSVTKSGKPKVEKRVYRRMPNLYFFSFEVKTEETKQVVRITPEMELILAAEKEIKNVATVQQVIKQMPGVKSNFTADLTKLKNQENFVEKLSNLKKEQIVDFIQSLLLFTKGQSPSVEQLKGFNTTDLLEMLKKTFSLLEEVAFDFMTMMLNRLQKNKVAKPSYWENFRKGVYPL